MREKRGKMKSGRIMILLISASLVLCPFAVFPGGGDKAESAGKPADDEKSISVMLSEKKEIKKTEMREYLIGCVAAEMSPLCHSEALKAQAAASRSYAMYVTENGEKEISDDPGLHQGYISEKERKEKWKENYEKYEKKIGDAVDAVDGYEITFNGKTAMTVYHSVSAGRTQSAKNAWGEDYPYLRSVNSPGDVLSPERVSKHIFSSAEYVDILEKNGIPKSDDPKENVGKTTMNTDGYVSGIEINGISIPGYEFRNFFGLESTCFEIEYSGKEYIITCTGNGHGAGMSQYGADYMARQGSTWQEIITHYYSGVEIKKSE